MKGGLKIGGMGGHAHVHGNSYGYGVYLAEDAGMSCGYATGANKIFACRGKFIVVTPSNAI